jgi:hypothetical protein
VAERAEGEKGAEGGVKGDLEVAGETAFPSQGGAEIPARAVATKKAMAGVATGATQVTDVSYCVL